ncbi:hypothetical protein JB92DRAFT_1779141 [Gautieria morchelliformis]|nr:hypothetical protein JB92DRAFT_1779141 [Gautieria morchelliformis]
MCFRLACLIFAFKLVATPYLSGLVAVVELFPFPTRRLSDNIALPADIVVKCLFLVITIINFLWTVVLVATFWRDRRILRQANVHGVMPFSMLRRLVLLCLYQLAMTIFSGVFLFVPEKLLMTLIPLAESIYPLLVFFSMGLRRDIMHAWFPCWVAQAYRTSELTHELDFNMSVNVVRDVSRRSGRLGDQLEEKVVNVGSELSSTTVKPEDSQYTNRHGLRGFHLLTPKQNAYMFMRGK